MLLLPSGMCLNFSTFGFVFGFAAPFLRVSASTFVCVLSLEATVRVVAKITLIFCHSAVMYHVRGCTIEVEDKESTVICEPTVRLTRLCHHCNLTALSNSLHLCVRLPQGNTHVYRAIVTPLSLNCINEDINHQILSNNQFYELNLCLMFMSVIKIATHTAGLVVVKHTVRPNSEPTLCDLWFPVSQEPHVEHCLLQHRKSISVLVIIH